MTSSTQTPFAVGLTGGIACGKSLVGQQFQQLGAHVLEADDIVRELTQPGQTCYQAIVDRWGSAITNDGGQLDRRQLRQIIFNDPQQKKWLENLIHPQVRQSMNQHMTNNPAAYHILVIPLLIETLPNPLIQRILVVDAPREIQFQRLVERDHINTCLAQQMIDQQADPNKRRQYADDIIDTHQDWASLKQQIQRLDQLYRKLAQYHH